MHIRWFIVLILSCCAVALGDSLKLTDGTVLQGHVIVQGDNYWIKLADGTSRTVAKADVAQFARDSGGAAAPTEAAASVTGGASFVAVKSKADRLDAPLAAVAMWQTFIDSHPSEADLAAAKAEQAIWQKRVDDNAEKINGKWIGGEEHKALMEKVQAMSLEADRLLQGHQTLQAVEKLNAIIKIYPQHFAANFWLGYLNLVQHHYDQAQENLENALHVKPDSPEALTDYAIVLNFRKQYEKAVLTAYKAADLKDSKEIVQNLIDSLAYAPPAMLTNNKNIRPALDASRLLASKYGINGPNEWTYVGLEPTSTPMPGDKTPSAVAKAHPGIIGNGSGFIISSDGLIVTNKHVAAEGDMLIVRLADGTEKQAERVVIDDDQDLALIRIKSDKPLPYLQFASADEPSPGAECTALGFPLGDVMHLTLQVTPGTVSSVIDADTANVVVTCKVNPGNSGGPLVDKYGNVVGIVTQKTFSGEFIESYGKAIASGRIREFLKKYADKTKANIVPGQDGDKSLDTEAIYKKVSPCAVCVIIMKTGEKKD